MSKYLESHVSAYVINSWHFQNFTIPGLKKKTVITKYEEENKNNHPNIFFVFRTNDFISLFSFSSSNPNNGRPATVLTD